MAVDTAALTLTNQRLSASLGQKPPWSGGENSALLQDLAGGRTQLVRVTFPLGALAGGSAKDLRAARLGSGRPKRWKMTAVWDAPADAAVPGRSFFAVLRAGERAKANGSSCGRRSARRSRAW